MRVMPLAVSGGFHTELMQPAYDLLVEVRQSSSLPLANLLHGCWAVQYY